jgi:plasmid stability protein
MIAMMISSMDTQAVGQVLIRNVDDAVIAALRARAVARGLSLEAELRDVLSRAAGHPRGPRGGIRRSANDDAKGATPPCRRPCARGP